MSKLHCIRALLLVAGLGLLMTCSTLKSATAQGNQAKYVGTEACSTCHSDVSKKWALTVHRKTLFNSEESRKGCESCHGPGSEHVATGDPAKIIRMDKLSPQKSAEICLKCHTQEKTMLWPTGRHARAKLTCMNCHDPHSLDTRSLMSDMEAGKLAIEVLNKAIKDAQLRADIAAECSKEKADANAEVVNLQAKRTKLEADAKGAETVYRRVAEPYLCYSCHKAQEVQSRMPSHHPIVGNKMKCSDCHNAHGGPNGMLNEESVQDTCAKCHAEKVGPFTFEHPPVTEDCTICHKPHGSVQNNLLAQSEPFLCLKCHASPHSDNTPASFGARMTLCTQCHNDVHGSDRHDQFQCPSDPPAG